MLNLHIQLTHAQATISVDDLKIGESYPGTVASVVSFGAFVNIGCGWKLSKVRASFIWYI